MSKELNKKYCYYVACILHLRNLLSVGEKMTLPTDYPALNIYKIQIPCWCLQGIFCSCLSTKLYLFDLLTCPHLSYF